MTFGPFHSYHWYFCVQECLSKDAKKERPGRRKIKSKDTGAGVRRPGFILIA